MTCSGEASFTQKLRLFTEFPWSEKTTGLESHFSPSSPSSPLKSMIFLECCVSRHAHIQQTPQPAGFQHAQPSWGKPGAQPVCWATLLQWVPLAALGMRSETCSLQGQPGLSGEWPQGSWSVQKDGFHCTGSDGCEHRALAAFQGCGFVPLIKKYGNAQWCLLMQSEV